MDDAMLCQEALAARDRAHAPYSGFRVGAALLCEDGEVVTAANLENSSLGLSVCAERNAVARAVYLGKRSWKKLAIATDAEDTIPPCGACRQVLMEFARDLEILLVQSDGQWRSVRLSELYPQPFEDYPRSSSGGDRT
jgi:cytidine deaminase